MNKFREREKIKKRRKKGRKKSIACVLIKKKFKPRFSWFIQNKKRKL